MVIIETPPDADRTTVRRRGQRHLQENAAVAGAASLLLETMYICELCRGVGVAAWQ